MHANASGVFFETSSINVTFIGLFARFKNEGSPEAAAEQHRVILDSVKSARDCGDFLARISVEPHQQQPLPPHGAVPDVRRQP
jgi:hypothetical protein